MSAPLEIAFEARISAEVRKLGPLRMSERDIKRVGDIIGNVTIEVYGDKVGRAMVASAWQREAAARYTIAEILREKDQLKDSFSPGAPSWLL